MSDEKKSFRVKATTMHNGAYVYEGDVIRATSDEVKGIKDHLEEVKDKDGDGEVVDEKIDAAPSETPVHQTKRAVPAKDASDKKAAKAEEK